MWRKDSNEINFVKKKERKEKLSARIVLKLLQSPSK